MQQCKLYYFLTYGLFDATNILKHSLIGQLIKFFLLIDQSNGLKHL